MALNLNIFAGLTLLLSSVPVWYTTIERSPSACATHSGKGGYHSFSYKVPTHLLLA